MPKVQDFSERFEQDLARIGENVEAERKKPESANLPERELVKRSVQAIAHEVPASPAPAPTQTPASPSDDAHLPSYVARSGAPEEAKRTIESLVHLALDKGLEDAVRASKRQPYFIEDAFHDALTDKALPELKKRGIIH